MRAFLKLTEPWLRPTWILPLALLTLPNCTLFYGYGGYKEGTGPDRVFDPGSSPTGAVMCDIPKVVPLGVTDCASQDEMAAGMSLAHAAVALNLGENTATNPIVLDFSSTGTCNGARKITFQGLFPDGLTVCLDCAAQIPAKFPDAKAACVAKCTDLITFGEGPQPPGGAAAFCGANAHVSTNFQRFGCFTSFCTNDGKGGKPISIPNPDDLRRNPDPVTWGDHSPNTTPIGNTLSFPGPGDPLNFIAGGASDELITTGDAWVEFAAGETGVSHVVGLRTSCDKIADCPDMDHSLADIPLALSLNSDGGVYILENGNPIAGPFPQNYAMGERFRIHVVDHNDKTAAITFFRYGNNPCVPNNPCAPMWSYPYQGTRPNYPLRVDATFRQAPASLVNVTIMRIIQ